MILKKKLRSLKGGVKWKKIKNGHLGVERSLIDQSSILTEGLFTCGRKLKLVN